MTLDPALASVIGHRFAHVDGVRLHYVEAGPPAAPAVVMLHGFPESWYSWRRQIPPLVAAGHRVIAPDMRGVGDSERPRARSAYALARLADDAAGVMRAAGVERATVVGHDWGAAIAWQLAEREPRLVARLAVLNGPHPGQFVRALRDPRQAARSLYMLAFQLPWLPERVLGAGGCALLRRALVRRGVPGAFTAADLDRYRAGWQRPGELTGALAPYRALARRFRAARGRVPTPVAAPVLVIWGERDPYLGRALADPCAGAARALRVERIAEAGHFVQADAAERVTALLLAFIRAEADR